MAFVGVFCLPSSAPSTLASFAFAGKPDICSSKVPKLFSKPVQRGAVREATEWVASPYTFLCEAAETPKKGRPGSEILRTTETDGMEIYLCADDKFRGGPPTTRGKNACYPLVEQELAQEVETIATLLMLYEQDLITLQQLGADRLLAVSEDLAMSVFLSSKPRKSSPGRACYGLITEMLLKSILQAKAQEVLKQSAKA